MGLARNFSQPLGWLAGWLARLARLAGLVEVIVILVACYYLRNHEKHIPLSNYSQRYPLANIADSG